MLIVSDTSALSALARMGWLEWLRERWEQVVAPEAVWRELELIRDAPAAALLCQARESGWLTIRKASNVALMAQLQAFLDSGESEAIALAVELGADAVMLDEMDGRNAAMELGLPVTGTLGLIVWAKRAGRVASVEEAMSHLVETTRFFVSEGVRMAVLKQAGEEPSGGR